MLPAQKWALSSMTSLFGATLAFGGLVAAIVETSTVGLSMAEAHSGKAAAARLLRCRQRRPRRGVTALGRADAMLTSSEAAEEQRHSAGEGGGNSNNVGEH